MPDANDNENDNLNHDDPAAAAPDTNDNHASESATLISAIQAATRSEAIERVYAYFTKGGTAYTRDDVPTARMYCTACLENEIKAVREARQQFGQGTNASLEVLTSIAMGRIEFRLPQYHPLLTHLRKYCPYQTRLSRKAARAIYARLRELNSSIYRNPADYGSVYEETAYPKYAGKRKHLLVPGSASPAEIFASHERGLLKMAKARRKAMQSQRDRLDHPKTSECRRRDKEFGSDEEEAAVDSSETEESEAEEQDNAAIDAKRRRLDLKLERNIVDEGLVYEPNSRDHASELPDGFPESETLKALQSYSRDLYAANGLLSSELVARDEAGNKIVSMVQALDGSALTALGILTQELVRASVFPEAATGRSRPTQPMSDFYTRAMGQPGWVLEEGKKQPPGLKKVTDNVLRALPKGSEVGMKDLIEACRGSKRVRETVQEGLKQIGADKADLQEPSHEVPPEEESVGQDKDS